ncbi:PREDICTED: uncharacterized protein C11orf57 homolog [Thamnophis sirtalis]|uniref:Uncharacterized protein C11orf57 homolog n=1 Tax=Thamnophis sirtalis TaxID=35019 RepID=A0A6I9YRG9_9SAUR|nr:PREDICTED: uncharacterized protein C11orf57 homolog [Thamnophis sirtalis]
MSRVPLGKVLLRNVIRHTDAHNKIQEESEMWKIREMEKQSQEIPWGRHERTLLNSSSSRMRSDGFDEDSQQATGRTRNMPVMAAVSLEDDLQHTRYWNKKLYECEANMPDRWGHSGYKELYPEEFDTDSDREPEEQNSVNGKRKSQSGKPSSAKLHKRKKAKKSHKKKQQKKKSHKKKKKKKRQETLSTAAAASSQESECSEGEPPKRKKKRHKKAKKASEQPPEASSSDPGSGSSKASSCASSHSGDSDSGEPARKRRKRQASLSERTSDRAPEKRNKRKNWKVAADENSEDSSEED